MYVCMYSPLGPKVCVCVKMYVCIVLTLLLNRYVPDPYYGGADGFEKVGVG